MTDTDTVSATKLTPAPMPPDLHNRMRQAIQEAEISAKEDFEMECLLSQLQPAAVPVPLLRACQTHMQQTRRITAHCPYTQRSWWRTAAVACVVLVGILGPGSSLLGFLEKTEAQGLAHRSVLERTGGETIQWSADGAPMREYEVMYEDSFILSGEDDTTLVIRVPNKTTISVQGELI